MKKIIFALISITLLFSGISNGREVNFSWKPIDEGTSYEIQIDTKEDFLNPTVTQIIPAVEYKADLFPGKYFYRVRVNDGKNTPGKWTDPTPVSVHGGAPDPMQPADKLILKYYEIKPSMNLSWSAVDKAVQYKINIKDGASENIVDTNVTETAYKIADLTEGTYQWQVASVLEGDNISPPFPMRTFQIVRVPLTIPILKAPVKNDVQGLKNNPIVFEWKQDPNTHFTDITIQSEDESGHH